MTARDQWLVLVGTKAQLIKTAPVLLEMDRQGVPYWLVYTGQHSETFDDIERAFGTRPADEVLVPAMEASNARSFARWSLRFWMGVPRRAWSRRWRGCAGAIVHGDTASTLFGAFAARLAGLPVAHLEAGLRSDRLLQPFPEELVRRIVSRLATLHLAPDAWAAGHLGSAPGRVVDTGGNTLRDALAVAVGQAGGLPAMGGDGGYVTVSLHRTENLRDATLSRLLETIVRIAALAPVKFVLHPVTRERIARTGWLQRLEPVERLELVRRMPYPEFIRLLAGGNCLLTDGGSNQEEAAMLGLPTLLLRETTERPDGLGDCVSLSHLDPVVIESFVARHVGRCWPIRTVPACSPSASVVAALLSVGRDRE